VYVRRAHLTGLLGFVMAALGLVTLIAPGRASSAGRAAPGAPDRSYAAGAPGMVSSIVNWRDPLYERATSWPATLALAVIIFQTSARPHAEALSTRPSAPTCCGRSSSPVDPAPAQRDRLVTSRAFSSRFRYADDAGAAWLAPRLAGVGSANRRTSETAYADVIVDD
jgi:hypothetical protein